MEKIIHEFNVAQAQVAELKRQAYGGANRSERRQAEKMARRDAKKRRAKVPA